MFGSGQHGGKSAEVRVGFRKGFIRWVEIGIGSLGALGLGALGLKLLQAQPDQGFGLLKAWGPWPFLAMVLLAISGHVLNSLGDTIRTAFANLVESSAQSASAQQRMAEAMGRIAEKDDRQLQEIQTLAAYTAQQSERLHRRHDETDEMLRAISRRLRIAPGDTGNHV